MEKLGQRDPWWARNLFKYRTETTQLGGYDFRSEYECCGTRKKKNKYKQHKARWEGA